MDLRGTISRALSSKRSARVAIAYRWGDTITEHGEETGIFELAYGEQIARNKEKISFKSGCYKVNSFIVKTLDGRVCGIATLDEPRSISFLDREVSFSCGAIEICSLVFDQLDKVEED